MRRPAGAAPPAGLALLPLMVVCGQSLAQQGNKSLAVLLERSGIALADVSVGAQQQQRQSAGQNSEPQRDRTDQVGSSRAAARVEADASMSMHALAAQALRADGSRPLDLFV